MTSKKDKIGNSTGHLLNHRRNGGMPFRQTAPVSDSYCYDSSSPHCSFQGSLLLRNIAHMAETDYTELLGRSEYSNGGLFNKYNTEFKHSKSPNKSATATSADAESVVGDSTSSCAYAPNHLLDRMTPVFRTMKLFGFYGPFLDPEQSETVSKGGKKCLSTYWTRPGRALFLAFTVALASFNLYIFGITVLQVEDLRKEHTLMHVVTMSFVISAIKPLQDAFNLLSFAFGSKSHATMWYQLAEIDETFRRYLGVKLNVRPMKLMVITLTLITFLFAFVLRATQYFMFETDAPAEEWLVHASLLITPLLSVWQLMPLFYYLLITSFLRWWFYKLRRCMQNDQELIEHSLEFYYRLYLKMTKTVATLGSFFNPVAFFCTAISVIVLCLTIYFMTNSNELLITNLEGCDETCKFFFVCWSCLHILVAIGYVATLCVAGWRTNERARDVMGAVLSTKPTDEHSRFRVTCFLHRNQTQWNWGITIWRAFPVERSFLFTLVSAISTYAVLLLKMKQKACVCSYQPSNDTLIE